MSPRRRFQLVYLLLILTAAGSCAGGALLLVQGVSRAGHAASCPREPQNDPTEVATGFVENGVGGQNLAASYDLALPSYRQGRSCVAWLLRPPFTVQRKVDWTRSSWQSIAGGTGQVIMRVILRSRDPRVPPRAYDLEVQAADGVHWQVGAWMLDKTYHPAADPVEAGVTGPKM